VAADNSHAWCVRFSRAWIDSSGQFGNSSGKLSKNGVALPMLAMEAEMKTQWTTREGRGFTLTELLVVICVIAVLAAVFLSFNDDDISRKAQRINCVNNLKQIALASRIWEGDNGNKYPMQFAVTNDATMKLISDGNAYVLWQTLSNELGTPKILICPADQQQIAALSFAHNFSGANISYFLNLDASDAYPQMILSGDDNLEVNGVRVRSGILNLSTNASVGWTKERHGGAGNIALSDGSVWTTTTLALRSALVNTGFATNRLVIP
jgi:prepilin-type N-terminal cleavage/methylation domain-containing protein/prepilin-type processing-associated H-X9-DG protein